MLGRAFEAQTLIAVVNAVLTSIGFLILGIPSIALLATIVFFCSYVPVVGVMLSTLPAALFAFKAGGITLVLWLVVMVLIVHAVEAYMLNPIIYGRHMKMHPVAILMILVVGEHLFGIWGLLLGVPVAAFVWTYVIQGKDVRTAAT
jgi:predicted PurR-regulated permease PerM